MDNTVWTFDTLAQASRSRLEQVLLHASAPDPQCLTGHVYDGYNHDWLGQVSGTKFRKAFFANDCACYGLNQMVQQDRKEYAGEWRLQMDSGRPVEIGFFNVGPVSKSASSRQVAHYQHLLCFDYNTAPNPRRNLVMRAIRDYVCLPNDGDYGLLLGKAYLRVTSFLYIFASYFILGHRQPYERL